MGGKDRFGIIWENIAKFSRNCQKLAEFSGILQNLAEYGRIWLNLAKFGQIWQNSRGGWRRRRRRSKLPMCESKGHRTLRGHCPKSNWSPKGKMWPAVPVALLCMAEGISLKGTKSCKTGLFLLFYRSICPFSDLRPDTAIGLFCGLKRLI